MATPSPAPKSRMMWAVLLVIILVLAGIGVYFATRGGAPAQKILVAGTTDDEITFDTADAYDYFSINLLQNTMGMLLTYVPGTNTLKPDILTEVPTEANGGVSTDGKTYTLRIRQDAKFENGDAINATVVKYSIDRAVKLYGEPGFLLEPILNTTEYWDDMSNTFNWANYTARAIQVVDEYTVKINLRRVWSPFPYLLAFTITAPIDMNSFTNDKLYPNVIVSSGPYRMRLYIPHQRYELEANPVYYGTPPVVPRVNIVRYTTAAALKLAMQTGAIDLAYRSLLPQDFNDFKSNANVRTMEGESPYIRYIVFNVCTQPQFAAQWCPRVTPFGDVRVRQAFSYAVDRQDINTSVFQGSVIPLYSLIPIGMFGHTDEFQTRYGSSPDLTKASTLLQAAGYSAGSPLRITLWYTPSHYGDTEYLIAQRLKAAFEAVTPAGLVQVTLDQKDWASYKAAWRAGDFDIFLLGWFPDYFDADDYVFPFLHAASGGTKSFGNWYENYTMDGKIEQESAISPLDDPSRETVFHDIQSGLAWDAPYIPLFQASQQVVYKPSVSGIILDPIQFFRYFTINVA